MAAENEIVLRWLKIKIIRFLNVVFIYIFITLLLLTMVIFGNQDF